MNLSKIHGRSLFSNLSFVEILLLILNAPQSQDYSLKYNDPHGMFVPCKYGLQLGGFDINADEVKRHDEYVN